MSIWPKLLVFVRHPEGEQNVNFQKYVGGEKPNHRAELTRLGKRQAKIVSKYIAEEYGDFDSRFSSTYLRTQQLMDVLCPGMSYVEDSRLDERRMGAWHQQKRRVVKSLYPDAQRKWNRDGYYHYCPIEGGESCGDVEAKAHSFLTDLRLFHADKKVLVAAHGMWLMCMWRILSGSTVDEWYQRREERNTFRNASILSYSCTDGQTLTCLLDNYIPWEGRV